MSRGWIREDPNETFGEAVDELHRRIVRLEANVFPGELFPSVLDLNRLHEINNRLDYGDPWAEPELYEGTC